MDLNEPRLQSRPWTLWAGIFVVILILVAIAAWALTDNSSDDDASNKKETSVNQSTQITTDNSSDTIETNQVATIVFGADGFTPDTLTVKKGTVITIKNESDSNVQFSSDNHPSHLTNPEMNTSTIGPGESTTYTTSTVGTFGYHDHIDDNKTGTITVTE